MELGLSGRTAIPADIKNIASLKEAAATASARFKTIHILVSSAGVNSRG